MPEKILSALDETDIWRFLAARTVHAHIVAPNAVLQRIFAQASEIQFSYSDDVNAPIAGTKNFFVWDLDPRDLETVARSHPSCRVLGILRDVWPARLTRTNVFSDRPVDFSPIVHYAILCAPRSGSTFLCDMLSEAGIGRPREHIRHAFVELRRFGYQFEQMMQWMIERGTEQGIFGTKLVSSFFWPLEKNMGGAGAVERFFRERHFRIILLLRNSVEQAVSAYFAARTGLWHLAAAERPGETHNEVPYDGEGLRRSYRALRSEQNLMTEFAHRFPDRLTLQYSDLDADPKSALDAIAAFLGAAPAKMSEMALSRMPQKISKDQRRMQEYCARLERELSGDAVGLFQHDSGGHSEVTPGGFPSHPGESVATVPTPPTASAPREIAAEYSAAHRSVFGIEPPRKRWLNFPFEWGTPEARQLQTLIWAIEVQMIRRNIEALVAEGITGDLLEFGVARGNSLKQIIGFARQANFPGNIYGFDSFEGLPELTEGDREGMWHKGQFAADYDEVLRLINPHGDPKIKLVKGWFNDTLRSYAISTSISKVAFARIDCDLYQSAAECLEFIGPRLVPGAFINFDDWTDDINLGETRAFFEFARRSAGKWRFEMLARISLGGMHIRVWAK